jgi:ubiquitin-protein ligase
MSNIRLKKEVEKIRKTPIEGFVLSKFDTDPSNGLFYIEGILDGPPGTPFEYGKFPIKIKFPSNYPFDSPDFRFVSPLPFHPNIYAGENFGKVCITILEKSGWSPAQTVESIIISIRSLLADSSAESMANQEAGQLYRADEAAYNRRVIETMRRNGQYHPPPGMSGGALARASSASGALARASSASGALARAPSAPSPEGAILNKVYDEIAEALEGESPEIKKIAFDAAYITFHRSPENYRKNDAVREGLDTARRAIATARAPSAPAPEEAPRSLGARNPYSGSRDPSASGALARAASGAIARYNDDDWARIRQDLDKHVPNYIEQEIRLKLNNALRESEYDDIIRKFILEKFYTMMRMDYRDLFDKYRVLNFSDIFVTECMDYGRNVYNAREMIKEVYKNQDHNIDSDVALAAALILHQNDTLKDAVEKVIAYQNGSIGYPLVGGNSFQKKYMKYSNKLNK